MNFFFESFIFSFKFINFKNIQENLNKKVDYHSKKNLKIKFINKKVLKWKAFLLFVENFVVGFWENLPSFREI